MKFVHTTEKTFFVKVNYQVPIHSYYMNNFFCTKLEIKYISKIKTKKQQPIWIFQRNSEVENSTPRSTNLSNLAKSGTCEHHQGYQTNTQTHTVNYNDFISHRAAKWKISVYCTDFVINNQIYQ